MFAKLILTSLVLLPSFSQAKTVVALGDSVTSGYGVAKEKAYPYLLEVALQKKHSGTKVINAGIAGATTASAISNLKWQLRRPFEVLILCLGGNDGLRGLKLSQSKKNLEKAMTMAKKKNIKVLLVGMEIPKNYGETYRKEFRKMYADLAKSHDVPFVPFLLKDVGAVKSLNLPDGIHPNEKGYQKVTENLLPFVEKLL